MRIMTFNLLCEGKDEHFMKYRRDLAVRTIIEQQPDSVGVQEATPEWMKWLTGHLQGYDHVGIGRDNGKKLGEHAAIFYLKDKYKVIDSGNFWISSTPEVPAMGWDAVCIRICTWAVLEDLQTGEQYAHINTHLDHRGELAKTNGIRMILDKAASFNIPVVCTGDFNTFEGSPLYEQLMSGTLRDTKFLTPDTMKNATFHHFKLPTVETDIIDYVLVNNKVKPLVYRVITEGIDGKFVSDHYPVYADVDLISAG